jgi:pyruvate kinase
MIARGDLAVEIGFERLSEIQEEILWLCEAAHTPVIWATQVLEQLNKTGVASRSEITDAYKAAQAECIMVNKGTHLIEVLATLQNVARRSKRHHLKKRYALPPLQIAAAFFKRHEKASL